jgi:tetratricopeptide (TPR) repeat protein
MQSAAVGAVRYSLRLLIAAACVIALAGGEIRAWADDSADSAADSIASAADSITDAREALRAAAALVQQGRLDEADRQARLALDDPDTRAVACSVMGTIRLQQQRLDESAAFLREAIRLDANLLGAHINLAQVYVLQRDFSRALDTYDAALRIKPDALPALRQAAGIAEQQGEFERSLSYWIRARKLAAAADDPEVLREVLPEVLLGFGRVCLKMDLLDDAEPALSKAASLKPDDPTYQYTLAAAKVGKRQFEAAQALLEPLVKRQPADAQLQYALGSVLYIQGRLADAEARLKESVRLQPEQLASHHYLALIARDQGRDAEATAMLEALVKRYPHHVPSAEALGSLLMTAQRYDEAERHLREAVRLSPQSVKANYQLGLLLARMGRKDDADKQLALAKSLRQDDESNARLQLRLLEHEP